MCYFYPFYNPLYIVIPNSIENHWLSNILLWIQKKKETPISILRKRLKLTQKDFSEVVGAHQVTIRRWERGTRRVYLTPSQIKNLYLFFEKKNIPFKEFLDLFDE